MTIRLYIASNKENVLELFDLNTPQYFGINERQELVHYLDSEVEDYFIVEEDNDIIGAGGINYFLEDRKARISWDFVHPESHGKGIGSLLVNHRLDHIKKKRDIETIEVRTSQLVYKFYEKMGFSLVKKEKDFWSVGFDLYQMEKENK